MKNFILLFTLIQTFIILGLSQNNEYIYQAFNQKLVPGPKNSMLVINIPDKLELGKTFHITAVVKVNPTNTFGQLILPKYSFIKYENFKTQGQIYQNPHSINIVWSKLNKSQLSVEFDLTISGKNLPETMRFGSVFTFFYDGKRGQTSLVKLYKKFHSQNKTIYISENQ